MPETLEPNQTVDLFAERLRKAMQRPAAIERGGAERPPRAEAPTADDHCHDDDPAPCAPVGEGEHVVREGDCLSSIARQTGRLWETIWNDPANAALRAARRDPNVLLPGDRLTIPPLRPRSEPAQTEMRHRFVRLGQPTVFQLRLAHNGRPLAQRSYTLTYDNGEEFSGVTNMDGFLRCPMPSDALHGRLAVAGGSDDATDDSLEYTLRFGRLQPVESLVGVQQRLRNLGLYDGANTGELDERTRSAIEVYQTARSGLNATGTPDAATRQRLREEHGS